MMNQLTGFFRKLAAFKKFDLSKIVKIVKPRGRLSRVSDWDLVQMIEEVKTGKRSYDTTGKVRGVSGVHLKTLITTRGPALGHKPEKVFAQHIENKAKFGLPTLNITKDMAEWDRQLYSSKAQFTTIARRLGFTPEQLKATASPEALTFFRNAGVRRESLKRLKMKKYGQMSTKIKEVSVEKKETIKAEPLQPAAKAPGRALPSPRVKYLGGGPMAKNDFSRLNVGK